MNVEDAARHLLHWWTQDGIDRDPDEFDPLECALELKQYASPNGTVLDRSAWLVLADAERKLSQRITSANLVEAQKAAALAHKEAAYWRARLDDALQPPEG